MRRVDEAQLLVTAVAAQLSDQAPAATLRSARRQFEREYVALVLRRHRGHVGDAARALGMQRTNLYRKARQLGISLGGERETTE
jgi:DNA-binding NtrC family response regulator